MSAYKTSIENDDTISCSGGNDNLHGNEGDDWLQGNQGNDNLHGDEGDDTIHGGSGKDCLYGEFDEDSLYGGAGTDSLRGGDGEDCLWGNADKDKLYGQNGDDSLTGGAGNDTLSGGTGDDTLLGGSGNDIYSCNLEDSGNDIIDDQSGGHDRLVLNICITGPESFGVLDTDNDGLIDGLIIYNDDYSDSISLLDYFDNSSDNIADSGKGSGAIEQIVFDGESYSFSEIQDLLS